MDPDEALANIRMLAAKIIELSNSDDEPDVDPAQDLAIEGLELSEAAQALDEWIVKGGFLPAAWRRPALDAAAVTEWCERKLVTLGLTMVEGQMSLRVQPKPGSALAHPRIYAPTEGDPAVSVDALIAQAMRDL